MRSEPHVIREIVDRALAGLGPDESGIASLLSIEDEESRELVFAAARELRARHFGDAVFLYGFVYFSTYCRNHCAFCLYRRGNLESPRYRKTLDEVVAIAQGLADTGVQLIDLTMGEDPVFFETGDFDGLVELVAAVKDATGLPVMISPGVVDAGVLERLRDAGSDWYACYQETHVRDAYSRLRVGQSFDERVAARNAAHALGMLVEDGLLLGTGESLGERAVSLAAMREEPVQQVRVMTFVPQRGTPLAGFHSDGRVGELLAIATMRLTMPDRLIPASLDVDGIRGLEPRIDAGANVVTSLVPAESGLAGVSQSELDIDEGLRTAGEVRARLAAMGLRGGAPDEYMSWVDQARRRAAATLA